MKRVNYIIHNRIELSSKGLKKLPESIFKDSEAQYLDLSFNCLSKLPDQLSDLSKLEYLSLKGNQLKEFPAIIGRLKNLRVLDLSDNLLMDIGEGIGALSKLEVLVLNSNFISELPASLCELDMLDTLELWGNRLHELPASIWNLRHLKLLNVGKNWLQSIPPLKRDHDLEYLSLHQNGVQVLPDTITKLHKLKILNLNNNRFTDIPESVFSLKKLVRLDIGHNFIEYIDRDHPFLRRLSFFYFKGNPLVESRIQSEKRVPKPLINQVLDELSLRPESVLSDMYPSKESKQIKLVFKNLPYFPDAIGDYTQLEVLSLYSNCLMTIPKNIGKLEHLKELDLGHNLISVLPEDMVKLVNLEKLSLNSNMLTTIPPEIVFLPKLKTIDVHGNPLTMPPQDVCGQGIEAMKEYYEQLARDKEPAENNQGKIFFLGDEGVGKTSLIKKLCDPAYSLDCDECTTLGVSIHHCEFEAEHSKKHFEAGLWDFGGHSTYLSVHRFFLTKRSVYVVVCDSQKSNVLGSLVYWLDLIKMYGKDSPIIVVQNKSDLGQSYINLSSLQEKYPISTFIYTSCKTNEGLANLTATLQGAIQSLPQMKTIWPSSWLKVRDSMAHFKKPTIGLEHYIEHCASFNISQKLALIVLDWMHENGQVLHYSRIDTLSEKVICDPKWLADAVCLLLSNNKWCNRGRIQQKDFINIWSETRYRWKIQYLLEVINAFNVCIPISGKKEWIVPEKLDVSVNSHKGVSEPPSGQFMYRYSVWSLGVFTEYMKCFERYLDRKSLSRFSFKIRKDNDTVEFVQDTLDRRVVTVNIWSNWPHDVFYWIKEECHSFHWFYTYPIHLLVRCECDECKLDEDPYFYDLRSLKKARKSGKTCVTCKKSLYHVPLNAFPLQTELEDDNDAGFDSFINHPCFSSLSKKEKEIIILLSHHVNRDELIIKLDISPTTLKKHLHHIYKKLELSGQLELVNFIGNLKRQHYPELKKKYIYQVNSVSTRIQYSGTRSTNS